MSDVSGAFDHVDSERLCDKLRSFGVDPRLVSLVASWLRARSGRVVVGGQQSRPIIMEDMAHQGTVWGPPLWNSFFSDSLFAVRAEQFEEVMYADDLNAWRSLASDISDDQASALLRGCQASLHAWGRANRVRFDASKENFRILSRSRAPGDNFKILGIHFDTNLIMADAVEKCVSDASWRLYTLIRTRRFHTDA